MYINVQVHVAYWHSSAITDIKKEGKCLTEIMLFTCTGKRKSNLVNLWHVASSNKTHSSTLCMCILCRVTECLGSGQFGTVHKGVWKCSPNSDSLNVAIKTLKLPAKEEDRVKFLQEGAIMGQFRHPNVVKLHGIVTEKRTVCLHTQGLQSS